ncbi:MAG TPA: hypothetical protein VJO12_04050 [Stellaceae bacterium]|nr:hypothetical protein [Stellaceae bacterium]
MPKKTTPPLTDEERAKRIRETAREVEASNSAKDFDRAFKRIVHPKSGPNSGPKQGRK